jgi:hypothetical protein
MGFPVRALPEQPLQGSRRSVDKSLNSGVMHVCRNYRRLLQRGKHFRFLAEYHSTEVRVDSKNQQTSDGS